MKEKESSSTTPSSSRWLLFLWAFALPLHRPPIRLPFERTGVGEYLLPFAFIAAWPALRRMDSEERKRFVLLPLIFIGGFAISILFAIDRRTALTRLAILLYVGVLFLIARTLAHARLHIPVLYGLTGGTIVMAIVAWAMPQHVPELTSSIPRPAGLAESPNMIAIQCCAAIFSLSLLYTPRFRAPILLSIAFLSITALATFGHVAIAAAATSIFVLARIARPGLMRHLATTALALSLLFILLSLRLRIFPISSSAPFLIDTRPPLYVPPHSLALDMFLAHPISGVGIGCFPLAWPQFFDPSRFTASYSGFEDRVGVPLDTHSTFLGYLAEAGILGVVVLFGLLFLALRARRRIELQSRMYLDAALFFVIGISLFLDVLTNREMAVVLGVLFSLSSAKRPLQNRELVR